MGFYSNHCGNFLCWRSNWLKALSLSTPLTYSSWRGMIHTWKSSYNSKIWSKYFFCIFDRALHILHSSSGKRIWFMTMLWISIWNLVSYWISLSVSYIDKNSGIQTATKVVLLESFICSLTTREVYLIFSIFPNILSRVWSISSLLPRIPPTLSRRPLNFSLKVRTLSSPFSRMLGKLRNRRVWPVGAVSNTITSKSIFSIELDQSIST